MKNTSNKCNLSGSIIKTAEIYELGLNECWESRLANCQPQDIYIVDPTLYNDPNVFNNCDSIEITNKVLKHYVLTLDDLNQNNFTITYP